mgnify:FL=1
MNNLLCPVCKVKLSGEKTFKCENNHCFDISKYGVVNLALSNKSSKKRHGDDKMMVLARKDFLDSGYYEPIQKSVTKLIDKYCSDAKAIVDAGCGEGYYTKAAADSTNASEIYGIDISKEALRYFKKRLENALPIVSSIFKMPIKDKSTDIVMNMFAPLPNEEFLRILKDDGYLIRTFVLKDHLIELKQAIYDNAYCNKDENEQIDGFRLIDKIIVDKMITVHGENIKNLFCMTPYYYKTGFKDQQKLEKLNEITTKIQVETAIYQKCDFNKEL